MKLRNWLYQILLVAAVGISLLGCEPKAKQNQITKKEIDKSVLLGMVDSLTHILGKKDGTVADGRKFLIHYQRDYKLVVNGKPLNLRNSEITFVNISDQSYMLFVFGLSKVLQKQVTFKDLEKAFGKGILSPLPKEPISFSTMYQLPGVDKVFISVTSANLPNNNTNRILEIALMR